MMAAIRDDFVGVLHVYVGGNSVFLRAGELVPEGAQVREDVLAGEVEGAQENQNENSKNTDVQPNGPAGEGDENMPDDGDSREAWNAYAESVGVNPAEYSKKEALIEALKAQ